MNAMQSGARTLQMVIALVMVVAVGAAGFLLWPRAAWTADEVATLRALWLGSLPPLAPDPTNRYGDDPAAAALGKEIFFDTRFSVNGEVACATCHLPQLMFQDGKALSEGVGITNRRAMPIAGTAYSPWLFWDGRKDSQWAQALGPLENPVEHGGNRTQYVHLMEQLYRSEYEAIFGPLPDFTELPANAGPVDDPPALANWEAMTPEQRATVNQVYANIGKAIAAYERLLMPGPSRFDRYVEALLNGDADAMAAALNAEEIAGLRLFIGKAECTQCHNGPLFTDNHFHNTGVPAVAELPEDTGRAAGAQQVQGDEFNCLSPYSDAQPEECAELRFMVAEGHELLRQFKPPSLRDVAERAPYMHAGQIASLEDVVRHYNRAPAAPAGHSELEPLNLSDKELAQLVAFLHSLSAPLATAPEWLAHESFTVEQVNKN
jgi:cytochrome c peroxidase